MHVALLKTIDIHAKGFGNDSNGNYWIAIHIKLNAGLPTEKKILIPMTDASAGYEQMALTAIRKMVMHILCFHLWQMKVVHNVTVRTNMERNNLKRDVKRWGLYW